MSLADIRVGLRHKLARYTAPARGVVERLATRSLKPWERWRRGIVGESRYWRRYLRTELAPGHDGWSRVDPELSFDGHPIYDPLLRQLPECVRILDVGAGPLTSLPKSMSGKRIEIVAVDPLAENYDRWLTEAGVVPLVRTQEAYGERLLERFAPGSFDLVHACNALDHAVDPVTIISQMLAVCRPEGRVLLRHMRNEAENQRYLGLHQWNFDWRAGARLWLWSRDQERDVLAELADSIASADVTLLGVEVVAVLQPKA